MTKRRAKALYANDASRNHDWKLGLTDCRRCGCSWTKWCYGDCPCWKMRLPKRKEK